MSVCVCVCREHAPAQAHCNLKMGVLAPVCCCIQTENNRPRYNLMLHSLMELRETQLSVLRPRQDIFQSLSLSLSFLIFQHQQPHEEHIDLGG